jgi:curved DNA-binding protein CbpA
MDLYKILGVDENASQEEIKSSYRELVKKFHPDHNPYVDEEKLKEINYAYEVLGNFAKRKLYEIKQKIPFIKKEKGNSSNEKHNYQDFDLSEKEYIFAKEFSEKEDKFSNRCAITFASLLGSLCAIGSLFYPDTPWFSSWSSFFLNCFLSFFFVSAGFFIGGSNSLIISLHRSWYLKTFKNKDWENKAIKKHQSYETFLRKKYPYKNVEP